jgi:hypothetical protein
MADVPEPDYLCDVAPEKELRLPDASASAVPPEPLEAPSNDSQLSGLLVVRKKKRKRAFGPSASTFALGLIIDWFIETQPESDLNASKLLPAVLQMQRSWYEAGKIAVGDGTLCETQVDELVYCAHPACIELSRPGLAGAYLGHRDASPFYGDSLE